MSASTQNQALATLLYLYREVLEVPLDPLEGVVRARTRRRLPVVLSREEVRAVRAELEGAPALVLGPPYGGGLLLMEALWCPGAQVPACGAGMGLAAGVSPDTAMEGCHNGEPGPPSP